ncbi:hypothetical protein ACJQWK_08709 [Exserohilum turcicum]|uniref:Ubiquitin-like protease family profile domain-containing protein n=1 Tax=Exserohilum turcicum (strain 28A) TaxID=671987 RepID=R0KC78_EXST2|nr:uncharacterized protein SETTUDRAFT_41470 [Exserohilum turcica Et28A]EOA86994.1 hypothetical protein SETTUDRAFT_41470 [Exserohilum turcica Et28A]
MSNKRAYSAFLCSTPADASTAPDALDAPQPQAHQPTPYSSSRLCIPGAWPEGPAIAEDVMPVSAPTSFFTTLGRWAATVSVANLLRLPGRIANHFLRGQAIKAIPIASSTGSNKKRFVAAGPTEDEAPSPSVRARAHQARRQKQYHTLASFASPQRWIHAPSSPQIPKTTPASQSPSTHASAGNRGFETSPASLYAPQPEAEIDGDDGDISIDFSFDDILTSTPPRNPHTGSPVHVPWRSPRTVSYTKSVSPVNNKKLESNSYSASSCDLPQSHSPVGQVYQRPVLSRAKEHVDVAQNPKRANHRTPKLPSLTPMRRQLVKLQFGAEHRRIQATRLAEPRTEYTDQGFAEPGPIKITPTEAVNQDLSYLSDASSYSHVEALSKVDASPTKADNESVEPEFEYANDLSFLLDAPTPPPRRSVRWAKHAGAKPFYCDEKVSDMLDSTLEIIQSSPVREMWHNFQCNGQAGSDNSHTPSSPFSSADNSPHVAANDSHANDGGFHGIPLDTFDASDDSLEESALSLELVQELQNDLKTKLALAPPPPPPKPLITPLSTEETDILHTAAANTSHGLKADKWVIDQKLYARDFATLLPRLFNGDPRAWLNDNIVNEYLAILVAAKKKEAGFEHKRGGPAPPVHAFSSFWYSTADTSRWSNRFQLKGKQYLDAELILYPICDRGHWRLLAVYPKKRCIEYLDSMSLDGQKYIDKLVEYLKNELGDLYIADEWTQDRPQRSSQQLNGSDCGVFTLLNALALLRGDDTKLVLATNGMDDARQRIAATLLAGHPTTELS